jgi:vitamin K-dependent gamma-carboxylase
MNAALELSLQQRVARSLSQPVDSAGLVYFRIAFYSIMLWEAWRFLTENWVGFHFSHKVFYFTYWPFVFVHPWPGEGMTIHITAMAVVAIFLILGLLYRVNATLFFFLLTYIFLLERALYLNHFYLVCLLAFLMIFVPAHRDFSLDAWRFPQWRTRVVPAWSIWLLRFQIGVPYFFGGLAKLNGDWLRGEPLRLWLAERPDFPFLGPVFTHEAVVWVMTYGSLLLDLFVVFFLLNRRTRVFAYIATLIFHFMNSRLFAIGIFPWAMIAATAIFFEPDWPRRVLRDIKEGHAYRFPALLIGFAIGFLIGGIIPGYFSWVQAAVGGLGVAIAAYHLDEPFRPAQENTVEIPAKQKKEKARKGKKDAQGVIPQEPAPLSQWTLAFLGLWAIIQLCVPLRHLLIPGNVHWTEEGHDFSWHMMVRTKTGEGGFSATDLATGKQWDINLWDYLTLGQQREMLKRPHMIVQFAHYLANHLRDAGHQQITIHSRITVSLNGRDPQLIIDPGVDLAKVPYPWWGHADWILPLEVPLETAWKKPATPAPTSSRFPFTE